MRERKPREIEIVDGSGARRRVRVEHPYPVRLAHWALAIALPILAMSGLQILIAFPSFGPKLPPGPGIAVPRWAALGGWLAGGIQWHFTFMWLFLGAGTIIQSRHSVHGLTTASTIWLSAAVGIASGMGYYALTIITVAVGLFVLLAFGMLERLLFAQNNGATNADHHQKLDADA